MAFPSASEVNFERVAIGLPVQPTLDYLDAHPELWDQYTKRQRFKGSPHHDTKCVILRWCKGDSMREAFTDLVAIDYPAAKELGPVIAPLFNALLDAVPHEAIGRAMLVTLKPGGFIDEHFDSGNYAERYDRFHVALQSEAGNSFVVGGDSFHARAGEAFWFNVKRQHSVVNHSEAPRIHLIVDLISPEYRAKRGTYFQRERAHDLWDEITPLLQAHWAEIAHYADIPLDPDAPIYNFLEEHDHLRCYTARVGGRLVGYGIFRLGAMHYKSSKQAIQDVLFVLPEYRKGRIGYRLVEFCESQLRSEGTQVVYHHVKDKHRQLEPLLQFMKYELVDLIYAKRLDKG